MKHKLQIILIYLACFFACHQMVSAQWVHSNGLSTGNTDVNVFIGDGNRLYAGDDDVGMYASVDSGSNWISTNNGLVPTKVCC